MNKVMIILVVGMLAMVMTGTARSAILEIDFDGPGYVAGLQPPAPWSNEWGNTSHTVEAGVGYLGTQGLVVRESRGVVCDLPTPLTSEMGAVSISVLFNPQGFPSNWNYGSEGGVQIGWGEKLYGTGELRGVIFEHVGGPAGIYGPGSGYGTYMGSFTSHQWYQITFAIDADWQNMTVSAGPVGQTPVSMTTGWSGHEITRIWTTDSQSSTKIAYYDNVVVDFNVEEMVDLDELQTLAQYWLMRGCTSDQPCAVADWYTDGKIDLLDFAQLAQSWLAADMITAPRADMIDDFETGDFSALEWDDYITDWVIDESTVFEGSYSTRSREISENQRSDMSVTIDTTGFDRISFVSKVSSQLDDDYLIFYIDGVVQDRWSGELDWQVQSFPVTEGEHTFMWTFADDASGLEGANAAWIDNVRLFKAE